MKSNKYIDHYQKWHDNSNQDHGSMINGFHTLFDSHIALCRHKNIAVDIGCSFGFGLEYLEEAGFNKVYGYDIDEKMVSMSKLNGLNVVQAETFNVFVKKMKLKPKSINLILASDLIEHLDIVDACVLLKQIRKYLADDGQIILTTPNANSAISSRYRYIDLTHKTIYSETSINQLGLEAGYTSAKVFPSEKLSIIPEFQNIKKLLLWASKHILRILQRILYIAELGSEGKNIPLSPNIIAILKK